MDYPWTMADQLDSDLSGPTQAPGWIGFLVFHDEQRKGFGSAILSPFEEAVLRSFENASAGVRPENRASISLLEMAGWTKDTVGENDSGWLIYRKTRSEQAGVDFPLLTGDPL